MRYVVHVYNLYSKYAGVHSVYPSLESTTQENTKGWWNLDTLLASMTISKCENTYFRQRP